MPIVQLRLAAVRWSVTSTLALLPTSRALIRGSSRSPDKPRRLEVSRAVYRQPFGSFDVPGSTRYSVPACVLGAVGCSLRGLCEAVASREVVETRRLELLTLSLQRRCSSN